MPSKKALPTRELPPISKELLDQIVTGPMSPAEARRSLRPSRRSCTSEFRERSCRTIWPTTANYSALVRAVSIGSSINACTLRCRSSGSISKPAALGLLQVDTDKQPVLG